MKIDMSSLDPKKVHALLIGAISPLPVTLISTIGEDGIYNAAPFSLAFPISYKPPLICVSIGVRGGRMKDTGRNIDYTKDFVVNIMGEDAIKQAIRTAGNYASHVDEIKKVGLTAIAAEKVKSPLVAEAQVSMECKLYQRHEVGEDNDFRLIVFGEVLIAHLKEGLWTAGKFDSAALKAVGYLGNNKYCRTAEMMSLRRG
jgi:flavin reductase (DIM6/NTAB) family NADH-FMN oxidoreductase RutF